MLQYMTGDWAVIIGPQSCDHRGHRELTVTIYFLMGCASFIAKITFGQ